MPGQTALLALNELFNALIDAGLRLEWFHEHRRAVRAKFPCLQPRHLRLGELATAQQTRRFQSVFFQLFAGLARFL